MPKSKKQLMDEMEAQSRAMEEATAKEYEPASDEEPSDNGDHEGHRLVTSALSFLQKLKGKPQPSGTAKPAAAPLEEKEENPVRQGINKAFGFKK